MIATCPYCCVPPSHAFPAFSIHSEKSRSSNQCTYLRRRRPSLWAHQKQMVGQLGRLPSPRMGTRGAPACPTPPRAGQTTPPRRPPARWTRPRGARIQQNLLDRKKSMSRPSAALYYRHLGSPWVTASATAPPRRQGHHPRPESAGEREPLLAGLERHLAAVHPRLAAAGRQGSPVAQGRAAGRPRPAGHPAKKPWATCCEPWVTTGCFR